MFARFSVGFSVCAIILGNFTLTLNDVFIKQLQDTLSLWAILGIVMILAAGVVTLFAQNKTVEEE